MNFNRNATMKQSKTHSVFEKLNTIEIQHPDDMQSNFSKQYSNPSDEFGKFLEFQENTRQIQERTKKHFDNLENKNRQT